MAKLAVQYQIPIYPGAQPDTSHFNAAASSSGRVYLAYTTPDSTDKVVSFYRSNLQVSMSTSGAVTILSGQTTSGAAVAINVGQKMDGSGTSFSFVITPQTAPGYTNPTPVATTAPATTQPMQPAPTPTPVTPPQQPATNTMNDAATVYVPTSNSPDDNSSSGDQGSTGQSTDQTTQDQSTGTNNPPPDNSAPPGG